MFLRGGKAPFDRQACPMRWLHEEKTFINRCDKGLAISGISLLTFQNTRQDPHGFLDDLAAFGFMYFQFAILVVTFLCG